jgi:hypothetical protein
MKTPSDFPADAQPAIGDGPVPPPNPPVTEVYEREILAPALLVHPDGPWPSVEVPARKGAAYTETVASSTPQKTLSGPDEKRKRVTITTDTNVLIAFTGNAGAGLLLPSAAGKISFTYIGPVWLSLPSGVAGPAHVGVLVEYWAD